MTSESPYEKTRIRVRDVLENPPQGDKTALLVQALLALVVISNTLAVIVYTVPVVEASYTTTLNVIITLCLLVFTLEYILRLWSCSNAPTFRQRTAERLRYAATFYLIIDLISIIPLFFPLFFPRDIALLRGFRLLSIFKLGRYARYSKSLALLKRVIIKKHEIFAIMLFFLIFVILFSSTIMYLVENSAQPDKFSSIPAAIWWAMMTVTTVGYGDIIPVTPVGKTIASFVTILGVLLLALPSAILATGFIEERHKNLEAQNHFTHENQISLLERLGDLRERGLISAEEYEEIKGLIIVGNTGQEE